MATTARRSAKAPRPARKASTTQAARTKPTTKALAKPTPQATPKATAQKPQPRTPAIEAAATASAAAPAEATKHEKTKLVRDSFTIPAGEYEQISALKQRGIALGRPVKKSELLRAGLKALAALADQPLLAALNEVPSIKTGRPKAKKKSDKNEKAAADA